MVHGKFRREVGMVRGDEYTSLSEFVHKSIPRGSIFVMEDHSGARKVWELARIQGLTAPRTPLIHIDAHSDLGLAPSSSLLVPTTPEEVLSLSNGCGAYIIPAVRTRTVGDVTWVHHNGIAYSESEGPAFVAHVREQVGDWNLKRGTSVPEAQDVLLDIDLDYFTARWNMMSSLFLNGKIDRFMNQVLERVDPVITTIAISKGWIKSGEEERILKRVLGAFRKE